MMLLQILSFATCAWKSEHQGIWNFLSSKCILFFARLLCTGSIMAKFKGQCIFASPSRTHPLGGSSRPIFAWPMLISFLHPCACIQLCSTPSAVSGQGLLLLSGFLFSPPISPSYSRACPTKKRKRTPPHFHGNTDYINLSVWDILPSVFLDSALLVYIYVYIVQLYNSPIEIVLRKITCSL